MDEKPEKVYIGSDKIATTKFGDILKISFGPKDIETITKSQNEKGWVNVDFQKKREVDKYGNTHYGVLNTWKPTTKTQAQEADSMEKLGNEWDKVPDHCVDAPF